MLFSPDFISGIYHDCTILLAYGNLILDFDPLFELRTPFVWYEVQEPPPVPLPLHPEDRLALHRQALRIALSAISLIRALNPSSEQVVDFVRTIQTAPVERWPTQHLYY